MARAHGLEMLGILATSKWIYGILLLFQDSLVLIRRAFAHDMMHDTGDLKMH